MLPVIFTNQAELDVKDAVTWYEAQVRGLGECFLLAVDHAVAQIEENPLQFPRVQGDTSDAVKAFPLCTVFSDRERSHRCRWMLPWT